MRHGIRAIALLGLLLAVGCDRDAPVDVQAGSEPAPGSVEGSPDAETQELSESASSYSERCEAGLATAERLLTGLESSDAEPTVVSVLEPFDELTRHIDNNMFEAQLLFYVHPDADLRRVAGECDQRYQGLNTRLLLSQSVYESIAAVDLAGEDDKTRYFIDKQLILFRQNGVAEDDATRARIRELKDEIVALENEFAANVSSDVRSIAVESAEQLAGLPNDWIESHAPGEDGKIRVTTQYPDYMPFMRYAEDESLRKALYFEYNNRAYPANEAVLGRLVGKRHEVARLTGFESWADVMNANKMSGDAATVRRFIDRAAAAAKDRARADYQLYLERLRRDQPDAEAVMPWQASFIGNSLRKERFALDAAEVRPYFEYHRVRDGIFQLTGDLFGYSVRPMEAEVWHESVQAYEMWRGEELLGTFFLDMHPREGKFNHAAMFQIDVGGRDGRLPSAALVTNFPGEDGKGYMELREVETFLHEFGHLVHWLSMGHQRWGRNTDPEWDFIEAPSQMLENWLYDPETVRSFAVNDDGEPIPVELVEKYALAEDFGQGMFVFGQMSLADLSLSLHDRDPASFEIGALSESIDESYRIFGKAEGVHHFANFGHLANAPYAASYYLYMWSLVIADDMFSRFQTEGLRNRETSFSYRDEVLASGGSRPAADSIEAFLGRPYDFGAFQKRLSGGG